nr:EOG090X0KWJ [Chydorus sphaericus]
MAAISLMKLSSNCARLLRVQISFNNLSIAKYAKPAAGAGALGGKKSKSKLGPVVEKKVLPVETDPEKLVTHLCGSNILKQGQDVKLKPDSEYPEWLWTLRLGNPPPLEEMDQNTLEYWRRLRKLQLRRQSRLMRLKPF